MVFFRRGIINPPETGASDAGNLSFDLPSRNITPVSAPTVDESRPRNNKKHRRSSLFASSCLPLREMLTRRSPAKPSKNAPLITADAPTSEQRKQSSGNQSKTSSRPVPVNLSLPDVTDPEGNAQDILDPLLQSVAHISDLENRLIEISEKLGAIALPENVKPALFKRLVNTINLQEGLESGAAVSLFDKFNIRSPQTRFELAQWVIKNAPDAMVVEHTKYNPPVKPDRTLSEGQLSGYAMQNQDYLRTNLARFRLDHQQRAALMHELGETHPQEMIKIGLIKSNIHQLEDILDFAKVAIDSGHWLEALGMLSKVDHNRHAFNFSSYVKAGATRCPPFQDCNKEKAVSISVSILRQLFSTKNIETEESDNNAASPQVFSVILNKLDNLFSGHKEKQFIADLFEKRASIFDLGKTAPILETVARAKKESAESQGVSDFRDFDEYDMNNADSKNFASWGIYTALQLEGLNVSSSQLDLLKRQFSTLKNADELTRLPSTKKIIENAKRGNADSSGIFSAEQREQVYQSIATSIENIKWKKFNINKKGSNYSQPNRWGSGRILATNLLLAHIADFAQKACNTLKIDPTPAVIAESIKIGTEILLSETTVSLAEDFKDAALSLFQKFDAESFKEAIHILLDLHASIPEFQKMQKDELAQFIVGSSILDELKELLGIEPHLGLASLYEAGSHISADEAAVAKPLAEAWKYALGGQPRKSITPDFLIELHDITSPRWKGLATSDVAHNAYYTPNGLQAMESLVSRLQKMGIPAILEIPEIEDQLPGLGRQRIHRTYKCAAIDASVKRKMMQEFIDDYRQSIAQAGADKDGKLLAIATLNFNLTKSHPFRNGNQRTFGRSILNRCLIDNGFEPVFIGGNGRSPKENVELIKNAFRS